MKAKFIKTEGEYLEATIEINGKKLRVMDEFSTNDLSFGDIIDLEIFVGLDCDDEDWESIFAGNPEAKKELVHLSGWSYKAYGVITSIKPVMVDVGDFELDGPIESNDERLVGDSIAFTIERLNATTS